MNLVDRADIDRSIAVDLIIRTLLFTDWRTCTEDEIESVANRLLSAIKERL